MPWYTTQHARRDAERQAARRKPKVDTLNLYKTLCDLADEAGAVDTVIGRPRVLYERLAALRDSVGTMTAATFPATPSEPMEAFLLRDLARELDLKAPILMRAICAQGLGNYSVNMALPARVARAMREHFKSEP